MQGGRESESSLYRCNSLPYTVDQVEIGKQTLNLLSVVHISQCIQVSKEGEVILFQGRGWHTHSLQSKREMEQNGILNHCLLFALLIS